MVVRATWTMRALSPLVPTLKTCSQPPTANSSANIL
eukprot:CAMPEP_0194687704 /NCGR_PEP_ID=MMETSP0295-20121207/16440_1 /TAXON_ID=39354 /ORGANISM="Heterosigma akashiwo, Strain CCMP2393" /LENGTH=35 /DNA_ID= /DNA_START= /DNA_END= /DNA_ORIENTATION=